MAYPLMANPYQHFYRSRRGSILGIVLHVTAGLEDHTLPDAGAEATIKYGQRNTRPASWHGIVDSDSIIDCLPDSYTAFHVVGYNSRTLGLEIANADAKWSGKPSAWVDRTIRNAAAWSRPRAARYGLPLQLASRRQVDAAIASGRPFGFSYHMWLNPGTRIDPGKDFPWAKFERYLRDGVSGMAAIELVPPPGVKVIGDSRFTVDGIADQGTIKAWQRIWGVDPDGLWGPQTVGGMQRWLGVPDTKKWDAATRAALYKRIGYTGTRDWQVTAKEPIEQTRLLEARLNAEADELAAKGAPPVIPAGKAPPWPLPPTHRIGGNPRRLATWHDGSGRDTAGNAAIRSWQKQMMTRGWDLGPSGADGLWGSRTALAAAAFQREKHITGEAGSIGPATWAAAWETPVV